MAGKKDRVYDANRTYNNKAKGVKEIPLTINVQESPLLYLWDELHSIINIQLIFEL